MLYEVITRWVINAARSRSGHEMAERLAAELVDAFNSTGTRNNFV